MPRGARNSLRLWTMLDSPDRPPALVSEFNNKPVLVLAPHMDDETIGCGGAVYRHAQAGAPVTVVYMTDGAKGDPTLASQGLTPEQLAQAQQAYVQLRKSEAKSAAEILGICEQIYLDGPDGALVPTQSLVQAVVDQLKAIQPAIVYLPALTDQHHDHWGTNRIFQAALATLPRLQVRRLIIRGYEVWTPAPANTLIDITDAIETKCKALDAFVSQTKWVDYRHISRGLAAYRSMVHMQGKGYAEAFLETTPAQYAKLFDAICLRPSNSLGAMASVLQKTASMPRRNAAIARTPHLD